MMSIGFGVIGLGRIGRLHAELLKSRVEGAELVAVSDAVEGLARDVGERLKVRWYTDYVEMLRDRDVECVVIATPTYLHEEMILRCLEEGKHVFVEKPMTVSSDEARRVVEEVGRRGLKLQVGYMRRFDHAYMEAKKSIEEGRIGKPVHYVAIARDPVAPPRWAAQPEKSGGIFLDMLSHDFDMARWLMDSEVSQVYVIGGVYFYPEMRETGDLDSTTIAFRMEGGGHGLVYGARKSVAGYDLRTEVHGTEGTIYVGEKMESLYSLGTSEGVIYGGVKWFERRFYDAYLTELESFVKAVKEDSKPMINEEDGYRVVRIAEACWESYRSGRPVEVRY